MSGHTIRRHVKGWRVKVDLGLPSDYPDFSDDPEEAWRLWRADAAVEFTDALKDVCQQALADTRRGLGEPE